MVSNKTNTNENDDDSSNYSSVVKNLENIKSEFMTLREYVGDNEEVLLEKISNISEMIKEKEESGWLIIYLGADHDVFKQARSLNFSQERIMKYSKKDSVDTFKAVSRTTKDYSRGTGNKAISFTEDERRKSDK